MFALVAAALFVLATDTLAAPAESASKNDLWRTRQRFSF